MKTRIIHTKVWKDGWFVALSGNARLLWLYLLTNEKINISGIFEITDREIEFDTGIPKKDIPSAKGELSGKIDCIESWIRVKNVDKYNNYRFSEKNEKAYNRELELVPEEIRLGFGVNFTQEEFVEKQYVKSGNSYEHRKIAEKYLGRKLTTEEVVHHIDRDPSNNFPRNLAVVKRDIHIGIHNGSVIPDDTNMILVSDYCDTTHKSEIRNKKSGIRNKEQETGNKKQEDVCDWKDREYKKTKDLLEKKE